MNKLERIAAWATILGLPLAIIGVYFAYLQMRGSTPQAPATANDLAKGGANPGPITQARESIPGGFLESKTERRAKQDRQILEIVRNHMPDKAFPTRAPKPTSDYSNAELIEIIVHALNEYLSELEQPFPTPSANPTNDYFVDCVPQRFRDEFSRRFGYYDREGFIELYKSGSLSWRNPLGEPLD